MGKLHQHIRQPDDQWTHQRNHVRGPAWTRYRRSAHLPQWHGHGTSRYDPGCTDGSFGNRTELGCSVDVDGTGDHGRRGSRWISRGDRHQPHRAVDRARGHVRPGPHDGNVQHDVPGHRTHRWNTVFLPSVSAKRRGLRVDRIVRRHHAGRSARHSRRSDGRRGGQSNSGRLDRATHERGSHHRLSPAKGDQCAGAIRGDRDRHVLVHVLINSNVLRRQ